MALCEAKEENGKVCFSIWFRISLVGFSGLMVTTLTMLVTNVIANDIKYMDKITSSEKDIARLEVQYDGITNDLKEIKGLLRRAIP